MLLDKKLFLSTVQLGSAYKPVNINVFKLLENATKSLIANILMWLLTDFSKSLSAEIMSMLEAVSFATKQETVSASLEQ